MKWNKFDSDDKTTWPEDGIYWVAVRFFIYGHNKPIEYVDRMKFFNFSDDSDSDPGWQGEHEWAVIGWAECKVPEFPVELIDEDEKEGVE